MTFRWSPPKPVFEPAYPGLPFSRYNPQHCVYNCTNELNYFSHTVGFGLRYATPVGPIRIDLGYQINRPEIVIPEEFGGILPTGNAPAAFSDFLQSGIESLMRRCLPILSATILLLLGSWSCAQEVLDRIVARVENDVILQSDMRDLGDYQILMDGKAESDAKILDLLIDEWIVRNEATVSRIAQPTEDDVDKSIARLKRSLSSPEEFEERRKQSGLSDDALRRLTRSQIYLSNYLDTRFRASIQVEEKDIEDFYRTRVVPRAESRGQTPPTLEVRTIYRGGTGPAGHQRAVKKWLKESRARIHVDILLGEGQK